MGTPEEYDLPLVAGFSGYAKYSKDEFGRVHIVADTITSSSPITGGATFAVLPVGFRPAHQQSSAAVAYSSIGSLGYLLIQPNGELWVNAGDGTATITAWGWGGDISYLATQ